MMKGASKVTATWAVVRLRERERWTDLVGRSEMQNASGQNSNRFYIFWPENVDVPFME